MTFTILYFGLLAERRGLAEEQVASTASTPRELYTELDDKHPLGFVIDDFRVAVNNEFVSWDQLLLGNSVIAFLPPMSGG